MPRGALAVSLTDRSARTSYHRGMPALLLLAAFAGLLGLAAAAGLSAERDSRAAEIARRLDALPRRGLVEEHVRRGEWLAQEQRQAEGGLPPL